MSIPTNDELRLMCGELTADECRLVRSVWPVAYKAGLEAARDAAMKRVKSHEDEAQRHYKKNNFISAATQHSFADACLSVVALIDQLPARIYEGEDGA